MAEQVSMRFKGTGLQSLGWALLWILLGAALITLYILALAAAGNSRFVFVLLLAIVFGLAAPTGTAWLTASVYRWVVRNLSFSDGTTASFEGRSGQVRGNWSIFYLTVILLPIIFLFMGLPVYISSIIGGLVGAAFGLRLVRWFVSEIRLSSGISLTFTGDYLPFLGWSALVALSFFTIIGWAWAITAYLRLACNHIDASQTRVSFAGDGWGLLWRGSLLYLAAFILTLWLIPWVSVWIIRWVVRNTVIQRTTA